MTIKRKYNYYDMKPGESVTIAGHHTGSKAYRAAYYYAQRRGWKVSGKNTPKGLMITRVH